MHRPVAMTARCRLMLHTLARASFLPAAVLLIVVIAVAGNTAPALAGGLTACCTTSGQCLISSSPSCSDVGGFPASTGTCSPNPCPQPTPCCFPDGTCTLVNLSFGSCPGLGTVVATCSPSPCVAKVCCSNTNGACTVVTSPNPFCSGGTLRPGPTCSPNPCPNQPVDCVVSDWSDWGPCSRDCGTGVQIRTRTVITFPANGGQACPELQEARTCNTQPCEVFCCANGVCTVVQGSACPSGQTQLPLGFTCSPNPCPQPLACCDLNTGACTVVMNSTDCPSAAQISSTTFTFTGQIQFWTVPISGVYRLTAVGANGGAASPNGPIGRGASVSGDIRLTAGTTLSVLVGGKGSAPMLNEVGGGGGGGTFIVAPGNTPLLVAGGAGGGGGSPIVGGGNGVATAAANADGNGGSGGTSGDSGGGSGGGGGGFLTSGLTGPTSFATSNGRGGASFVLGGAGGGAGNASGVPGGSGGFGGGGGGGGGWSVGGGGGGYNGGAGGDNTFGPSPGAGGTSFFSPEMSNTSGTTGGNTQPDSNGQASIVLLTLNSTCSPNPCPHPIACCNPTTGACTLAVAGQSCPNGTTTGTGSTCSPNPCPQPPVDCVVSDWSDWGPCSLPCGGGTQVRTRTVLVDAANGGQACPVLQESRPCNSDPCPVACCDPCGVCTIAASGACPSGTTVSSVLTTCSPETCANSLSAPVSGLFNAVTVDDIVLIPLSTQTSVNVQFDLSGLPAGASVVGATLSFRQTNRDPETLIIRSVGSASPGLGTFSSLGDLGPNKNVNLPTADGSVSIPVTDEINTLLAKPGRYAGFVLSVSFNPSAAGRQINLTQVALRVAYVVPRVCCAPDGACSLVSAQCCPSGTTELTTATTCLPNPCPQPTACCSPCGACSIAPPGQPCAPGLTSVGPGMTCSAVICPASVTAVSPATAAVGSVRDSGETTTNFFVFGILSLNRACVEFDLGSIPAGAVVQSAFLDISLEFADGFAPASAGLLAYAGDGVLSAADYDAGVIVQEVTWTSGAVVSTDVTASIRDRLSGGTRYAGYQLRYRSAANGQLISFRTPSLRIQISAPKVCCAPSTGTCSLVPADQCCPAGTTLLAGVLSCSPSPCPTDCVVSDWTPSGGCSLPCGGGTQLFTRSVITPAANGGTVCPALQESRPCNTDPCPIPCCDASGACAIVQAAACPPSSTLTPGGAACSPNPCPQPVACCSPCGACSVAPAGSPCPDGTTALSGVSACSPVNPCPEAGLSVTVAVSSAGGLNNSNFNAEFDLSTLPTGFVLATAVLDGRTLSTDQPTTAQVFEYSGDGVLSSDDLGAGDFVTTLSFNGPTPLLLDVRASIARRLNAGDRYAGFRVNIPADRRYSGGEGIPRLRLRFISPKVCCSSSTGACSLVAADQCCPDGTTRIAGATACSPNPCPQPVACCSPCGACSVAPPGSACPDGTAALSGMSTCSPLNACPAATTAFTPPTPVIGTQGQLAFVRDLIQLNSNTQRGVVEFDLGSVPPGVTLRSARLEFAGTNPDNSPATIDLWTYVGDGVRTAADADAGTSLQQVVVTFGVNSNVDLTALVRQRLQAGDRYLGFNIRAVSMPSIRLSRPVLTLELVTPKVCCAPSSGVCSLVPADQCCPTGTSLLAGAISCSPTPCPTDCAVSDWSDWGPCSEPCGGGVQIRRRSVLVDAANGGQPCPVLEESRPCNTDPCTVACCDPCGVCTIAQVSVGCPQGTTASSSSVCAGPACTVPAARITAATPTGFGTLRVFYAPVADADDFRGPVSASANATGTTTQTSEPLPDRFFIAQAEPAPGWRFKDWAPGSPCTRQNTTLEAFNISTCRSERPCGQTQTLVFQPIFELIPNTVRVTVTGPGTVTSTPAGILNCAPSGGTCEFEFPLSSIVRLTANPTPGSWFTGWTQSSAPGMQPGNVLSRELLLNLPSAATTVNVGAGFAGNTPPVARCRNLVIDARSTCPRSFTITPADIDSGSSDPDQPFGDIVQLSLDNTGPFPVGVTTVTLTVRDSVGLTSSCQATVTVLGQDCDGDTIPDVCQCFFDNTPGLPPQRQADAQMAHIGGGAGGGARVADDFYLPAGQVHRIFGFRGKMFTSALPGLRKARLDFFEDCGGAPAATPFATFTNSSIEQEIDVGNGFALVSYFFDLCDPAAGISPPPAPGSPAEPLWLDGGKAYWVSLTGQPASSGGDDALSYWVATPPTSPMIGRSPHKADGPLTGIAAYQNVAWGPWQNLSECCIGCVNMEFALFGESCDCAFENGPVDRSAVLGLPSGSIGAAEFRALDNFVLPPCDPKDVCLIEGYVWTTCVTPRPVVEIYRDACGEPGDLLIAGVPTATATNLNLTRTLRGKTFTLWRIRTSLPRITLAAGNYWLSLGALGTGSLSEETLFAARGAKCDAPGCTITGKPAVYRRTPPAGTPPAAWEPNGTDLAFRVVTRGPAFPRPDRPTFSLPDGSQPPACRVDADSNGAVQIDDIFIFLSAWFAGCP